MNQAIKEKWVAALRSGEYKQGIGRLCSINNEFCCLGVLTDLYHKEHNISWKKPLLNSDSLFGVNESVSYLSNEVLAWSELKERNPIVYPGDVMYKDSLAVLNDNGHSFQEIANLIEEKL